MHRGAWQTVGYGVEQLSVHFMRQHLVMIRVVNLFQIFCLMPNTGDIRLVTSVMEYD